MARLPTPGGDDGTWGDVLNDFLDQAHNSDGSLKSSAVSSAGAYTKPTSGIPSTDLDSTTQTTLSSVSTKATDSGVVHLTGTETITGAKTFSLAPTVPSSSFPESAVTNLTTDLAAKATDSTVVHLAGTETITGAKNFTTTPQINSSNVATQAQAQSALSMSAIIKSGTASVASNVMPPGIRVGYASTLNSIYVRCGTGPTTSNLTVRVNQTGSASTSWSVNVLAGNTTGSSLGLSAALAAGDIITFDITAIGSGTAGADIAVDLVGS